MDFLPYFITEPLYILDGMPAQVADVPSEKPRNAPSTAKTLEAAAPHKTASTTINIYGQNKSGVVAVLDIDEADVPRTKEYKLLLRIMEAVRLQASDFAAINLKENHGLLLKTISDELSPKHVLLFGHQVCEKFLPALDLYEIKKYGEFQLLGAESLTHLENRTAEKRKLWKALKEMFSV